VFSLSEGVISSTPGYNTKKEFLPQIHMIFLFSLDHHMPSYFRMVAGSITDVSSLVLTVREAGIHNVVMIGDKGFYSEDNVIDLNEEKLHYILPLKRNNSLIDYTKIQKGDKREFDGYFLFEKRTIWYYSYDIKEGKLKGKKITVFLDDRLKTEEEKDYLSRIEEDKNKTLETFFEHQHRQGTIAIITDLNESGERIYSLLKSRAEIEAMFDIFKNILNADRTYMRDDYQMEGWMFINFIALVFYYRLYGVLADNSLLKKYSPNDVLVHLSRIYKLKIQDQWIISEIPKKTRNIIDKLNLDLHIT
jgi:transposase